MPFGGQDFVYQCDLEVCEAAGADVNSWLMRGHTTGSGANASTRAWVSAAALKDIRAFMARAGELGADQASDVPA